MRMAKRFFLESTLIVFLLHPPLLPQTKSLVFPHPMLEVVGGPTFDFGNIYRGQRVSHIFTLKNEGADTLLIKNVSSSCGCTAAITSSMRVPPLSKTELNVTFNSEGYSGQVSKIVTVTSNDTISPMLQVKITANVLAVLEFNPGYIFVQRAKLDSISTTAVELKNTTSTALKILSVEPGVEGLKIDFKKKTLKPNEATTLIATFRPTREGMANSNVVLKTDFKAQPEASIRFTANAFK